MELDIVGPDQSQPELNARADVSEKFPADIKPESEIVLYGEQHSRLHHKRVAVLKVRLAGERVSSIASKARLRPIGVIEQLVAPGRQQFDGGCRALIVQIGAHGSSQAR